MAKKTARQKYLDRLRERRAKMLKHREEGLTFEQIAALYGVTRQAAHELIKKAIEDRRSVS